MNNIAAEIPKTPEEAETLFTTLVDRIKNYYPTLIFALVVFVIGFFLSKLIVKLVSKGLKRSKLDESAHSFLVTVIKIILYVIIIVSALSSLGADLTSVVTIIGAAGLAVSLALQNSLSNVAGGFIILFGKPFKKGDYIETCGVAGIVREIAILSTTLTTFDNKVIRIPNGTLAAATIVNYNEETLRRVDIDFSVGYSSDYKRAEEILLDLMKNNPKSVLTPEPFARITAHGDNAVIITARVWTKAKDYYDLKSDLLEDAKDAFDAENIEIPFNQVVVHKA